MISLPVVEGEILWRFIQGEWYWYEVKDQYNTPSIHSLIKTVNNKGMSSLVQHERVFRVSDAQVGDIFTRIDDESSILKVTGLSEGRLALEGSKPNLRWYYGPGLSGKFGFEYLRPVSIKGFNMPESNVSKVESTPVPVNEVKLTKQYPITPNEAYVNKREKDQQKTMNLSSNYGNGESWLKYQEKGIMHKLQHPSQYKTYTPNTGITVLDPGKSNLWRDCRSIFDLDPIDKRIKELEEDYDIPQPQKVKPVDLGDLWEL